MMTTINNKNHEHIHRMWADVTNYRIARSDGKIMPQGASARILYIVLLLPVNVILIFKLFPTLYFQLHSICTFLTVYMCSSQMRTVFTGLQSKVYEEVSDIKKGTQRRRDRKTQ